MPNLNRRTPSRRRPTGRIELTTSLRFILTSGTSWFIDQHDLLDDHEFLRAAWEEHGEEITSWFVERHPGRRPWGWWRFSRDEERPDPESEFDALDALGELTALERFAFVDEGDQ